MEVMRVVIFAFLFCLLIYSNVYAAWSAPVEVAVGSWGTGAAEFGISPNETYDSFPRKFYIKLDRAIVIEDIYQKNGRMKIYRDGQLQKITKCIEASSGDWNEECNILGDYIYTNNDGNIWTEDGRKYKLTTPNGQLLSTYSERPIELGVVKSVTENSKAFRQIKYEDITYYFPEDYLLSNYVRDGKNYLYLTGFNTVDVKDFASATVYNVNKYDKCGRLITHLQLPTSDYSLDPVRADLPGDGIDVLEEYGPPVIGPDGSVYCWKRTPDTYSILKWQWVDDPNDPQPGPDAPANLKLTPSLDGLYLTWDASPQDPGCVDSYELERATSADGVYSSVSTTDPGVLKFNDTGALPGSSYYYKVRAKSGGLYSPYSPVVSGAR